MPATQTPKTYNNQMTAVNIPLTPSILPSPGLNYNNNINDQYISSNNMNYNSNNNINNNDHNNNQNYPIGVAPPIYSNAGIQPSVSFLDIFFLWTVLFIYLLR